MLLQHYTILRKPLHQACKILPLKLFQWIYILARGSSNKWSSRRRSRRRVRGLELCGRRDAEYWWRRGRAGML